jgi:membrane-bound metal-dependent hydrolase YbcI (DUF457 family)
MYSGHFGIALASAGLARRLPLALLITASFACDIIEGVVAAFNVVDRTRVYSHSLPVAVAAGAVLGLGWLLRGGRALEALLLVLVAATHTGLDLITSKKAWWPGEPIAGLLLYEHPWLDAALEVTLCALAWAVYLKVLPPERRRGWLAAAPVMLLIVAQLAAAVHLEWFEPVRDQAMSKFVR